MCNTYAQPECVVCIRVLLELELGGEGSGTLAPLSQRKGTHDALSQTQSLIMVFRTANVLRSEHANENCYKTNQLRGFSRSITGAIPAPSMQVYPGCLLSEGFAKNFFENPLESSAYGEWCNGSTTDSDSVCLGSNPGSPATQTIRVAGPTKPPLTSCSPRRTSVPPGPRRRGGSAPRCCRPRHPRNRA